jgi:hypothetical protein
MYRLQGFKPCTAEPIRLCWAILTTLIYPRNESTGNLSRPHRYLYLCIVYAGPRCGATDFKAAGHRKTCPDIFDGGRIDALIDRGPYRNESFPALILLSVSSTFFIDGATG